MTGRVLHVLLFVAAFGLALSCSAPGALADDVAAWVAKAVSVQGSVRLQRAGESTWQAVSRDDLLFSGDKLQVAKSSRAALVLQNRALVRLDEESTVTFREETQPASVLLRILRGAAHFFSRVPRSLKITTPFVNGAVIGTEFFAGVTDTETTISVFTGRVQAANETGELLLSDGMTAIAGKGQAPALRAVARQRDAVNWALHYPPIMPPQEGDGGAALTAIIEMLAVGRADEARAELEGLLGADPENGDALALLAMIDLVQNRKESARQKAEKAVRLAPRSSAATMALAYVRQAFFDVAGARAILEQGVAADPENAYLLARLAEMWLATGYTAKALSVAEQADLMAPDLSRSKTVLGFAAIARVKLTDAEENFQRAIELDQTAPLPRLGLGLVLIRSGKLEAGRAQIEIAAALDPGNALVRSYLGKAFYDEKDAQHAARQFEVAKSLDPNDPTPYLYSAIQKQTQNRPVEALVDLEQSIDLNDNRAVYRSKLLLDEDLAARSASLGRIYNDLGFQQSALVEGWKSLHTDPANYSAHRLLADTYAGLPRHEIARVSELLQSQLLQPLNLTPLQARLAVSDLLILDGAGPGEPAFAEYNPLFARNRLALQASGVVGEHETLGEEVTVSGLWNQFSFSLGQFHYETDGFRDNHDQDQDLLNGFAQARFGDTSILGEVRNRDSEYGDLEYLFDPEVFQPDQRQELDQTTYRLGAHHRFGPGSSLIAHLDLQTIEEEIADLIDTGVPDPFAPPSTITIDNTIEEQTEGYLAEAQHILKQQGFNMISGLGYYDADFEQTIDLVSSQPIILPSSTTDEERDIRHLNVYLYAQWHALEALTLTVGASVDDFENDRFDDRDQVNPKFGLVWRPTSETTLRAAVVRLMTRTLIDEQTIEPTQVAGFNQFFDDIPGSDIWMYGGAVDQKISKTLFGGIEVFHRDLEVTYEEIVVGDPDPRYPDTDWDETVARTYLNWAPLSYLATRVLYQFERWDRGDYASVENVVELDTHRFQVGARGFLPCGLFVKAEASYIYQDGEFGQASAAASDDDRFWVVDAGVGYRLPSRLGAISVEAKNLFNESFKFQDTDPSNPSIAPERRVIGRVSLAF